VKIAKLKISTERYGGKIYGDFLDRVLSEDFEIEEMELGLVKKRYSKIIVVLLELFQFRKRTDFDIVIREFDSCFFINKRPIKQVVIIYHIDYRFLPLSLKIGYFLLEKVILYNAKKADVVVVCAEYWKDYFERKGFENIHLIYNAFDLEEFSISDSEIESFKRRFNLDSKPIIYLGNCQYAKGVVESYEALKELDVNLVTSGNPHVKIGARNFNLSYKDYLILLRSSSIVLTMSKFKEGWCRTAHEAMLLRTPVIGSGLGGMRELLENGGQIICEEIGSLREKAEGLLQNRAQRTLMGEKGYKFATQFDRERFRKDWGQLLKNLRENGEDSCH
jgi:glycosyltransferase involved in cell wall biosynthesis